MKTKRKAARKGARKGTPAPRAPKPRPHVVVALAITVELENLGAWLDDLDDLLDKCRELGGVEVTDVEASRDVTPAAIARALAGTDKVLAAQSPRTQVLAALAARV